MPDTPPLKTVLYAVASALLLSLPALADVQGTTQPAQMPPDVADLAKQLRHEDVRQRRQAALNLFGLDEYPDALLPVLRQAMGDDDTETRYNLLHAVANLGPEAEPLLPEIIRELQRGRPQIKVAALYALGRMGPPAAPAVAEIMKHVGPGNEKLRSTAIGTLVEIGKPARSQLLDLLLGPNKMTRLTVATTLRTQPELLRNDPELAAVVDWAAPPVMTTEKTSDLPNGSFEVSDPPMLGWDIVYQEGAEGKVELDETLSRTGTRSLKVTKTNGKGFIEIRSRFPVTIPPGRGPTRLRMYFHTDRAPVSSGVMLRFRDEEGTLWTNDNPLNGGRGLYSQSLARNAPPRKWLPRVIVRAQPEQPEKLQASILIQGNPATVWIDDVEFPAPPRPMYPTLSTYPALRYSRQDALDIVSRREPVTAEIQPVDGKATLILNGQAAPLVLHHSFMPPAGDYRLFEEAGVKLQTLMIPLNAGRFGYRASQIRYPGMFPIWNADGSVNVSHVETLLEQFARRAPHSNLVLAFYITWPESYIDTHPDEAWLDADGKRFAGTIMHLRQPNRGGHDTPPTGCHFWPSMYSDQAMQDAADVVRQVLAEIKKSPYANMVAGTMIMGGHDGQFRIVWADHSPPARRAWRRFLREKYKTDEALASAWHSPGATLDQADVPDISWESGEDFRVFYDPRQQSPMMDYKQFMARRTWQLQDYFAGVVKDAFDRPLLGITWQMTGFDFAGAEGFHDTRNLDVKVIQPSYELRLPGYTGGFATDFDSLHLRNKMVASELDLRSWFRGINSEIYTMWVGCVDSADDFENVCRKEIGRLLAKDHGWWFYDITKGAFRHPRAIQAVRKSTEVARKVVNHRREFSPDVAVIYHAGAEFFNRRATGGASENTTVYGLNWMFQEINTSGVPYDSYFFKDLKQRPELCDNYKLVVFLAPYFMTPEDRAFVDEHLKKDGKVLVWHYAPGYITPDGFDLESLQAVTGMATATDRSLARQEAYRAEGDPLCKTMRPLSGIYATYRAMLTASAQPDPWTDAGRFWITDDRAVPLAHYADGKTALAVRRFEDWTSVYVAALLGLGGDLLNALARQADAYVVCDPGPAVAMNGSFMSINGLLNGPHTFTLPRKATVTDAWTGETIATDATTFTLDLQADQTRWLLID